MPKKTIDTNAETTLPDNRIIMIDLENCPNQINQLMNNLVQYAQVVVCYAQSGTKVPLDWIVPLTTIVNEKRLKIVKMPNVGKNAADFGITFWAGALMSQLPKATHFDIVSDDADLDHVVSLLINQQRSAERIRTKKESIKEAASETVSIKAAQEYCLHLVTHDKNRPVKKETLLNSIKSKFNGYGVEPEALFQELGKHGAIVVKDNKISYNQEKITRLAKSI